MNRLTIYLDRLGMTASGLCAIHCAALPFIITALPLLGLSFLAHPLVEMVMLGTALFLGFTSLTFSYFKHHKNVVPFLLLILGFIFIAGGHFAGSEFLEPILIPLGGFTIAAAHYKNWRLVKATSTICQH